MATKRIRSSVTGEEQELCVVAIRGTYGTEWFSNVNVDGDASHIL